MTNETGRQVKCNKCGYIGDENEFPKGRDLFQKLFIQACAMDNCNNKQSLGDASLRMFPGIQHPFTYLRKPTTTLDPLAIVLHNAGKAS